MSETSRIEYKRELNDEVDLEKEVIAFLNYKEGGSIYFGIDKHDRTVGVSDIDGDMLKIKIVSRIIFYPQQWGCSM